MIEIEPDDSHPDACFVEDNAVVHKGKALMCRMGAESRRGEGNAVEKALKDYVLTKRACAPATIEGGDVLHLPGRLISGLSRRTNQPGVNQMTDWLEVRVDTISDPRMMHLKSYVTYLTDGKAICTKRFCSDPALHDLSLIVVPEKEAYAADTLTVGKTVLLPSGMPLTEEMLKEAGFETIALDVGEFEKCDGAITCLSIIF